MNVKQRQLAALRAKKLGGAPVLEILARLLNPNIPSMLDFMEAQPITATFQVGDMEVVREIVLPEEMFQGRTRPVIHPSPLVSLSYKITNVGVVSA